MTDYFNLITAQERLEASQQIVKTAQTTQHAAEAQLANGRSTLPDVLNARAATAQAAYDLQASIGAVDHGSRCTAGDHRGRAFGRHPRRGADLRRKDNRQLRRVKDGLRWHSAHSGSRRS